MVFEEGDSGVEAVGDGFDGGGPVVAGVGFGGAMVLGGFGPAAPFPPSGLRGVGSALGVEAGGSGGVAPFRWTRGCGRSGGVGGGVDLGGGAVAEASLVAGAVVEGLMASHGRVALADADALGRRRPASRISRTARCRLGPARG